MLCVIRTSNGNASGLRRLHVLHLTLVFPPDGVSTATIQGGLARELVKDGFRFTVVTTTPHYNRDPSAEQAQQLHPTFFGLVYRSSYFGATVFHIRVRTRGTRILRRAIDYAFFHAISLVIALTRRDRFDVILAASPPLTIGVAAAIVSGIRRVPFVYNVQEIYPDVAIDLGVLRNPFLIRVARWIETFVYRRARVMTTISERFATRIKAKGIPAAKVKVIPNFANTDEVVPGPKKNAFAVRHGLTDKFVALYAGNIGLTQDFETILAASEDLPPDIVFLVVGGGARAAWLREEVRKRNSPSMQVLPYQDSGDLQDLYALSSIGLVTLQKNADRGTFPSKVYTIMSSGRPCVVISDLGSDAAELVASVGCGLAVSPGDHRALRKAVMDLHDDAAKADAMGQRGREFVVGTHSPRAVAIAYAALLRSISGRT
jgi:colanic acid biosynthesis glycosyl transferase WcaI